MSFNRHAPPYRTEWQPRRYPGEPHEHDRHAPTKRTIEERLEALRLRRQLDDPLDRRQHDTTEERIVPTQPLPSNLPSDSSDPDQTGRTMGGRRPR